MSSLISAKMSTLAPVILHPRIKQTASMIFLHGVGDTGHSWSQILNTIRPDHLKVICPTAPVIPITLNMGFRMPAWFDIYSLENLEEETDYEGVKASSEMVLKYVKQEIDKGIPSEKIIIGGFSQGATLALYTTLNYNQQLAGCIALSAYVPQDVHRFVPEPDKITNKDIPFFQAHGEWDNILPIHYGSNTSKVLKKFLTNHQYKTYPMQHEASDREMNDVKYFIESVIGH